MAKGAGYYWLLDNKPMVVFLVDDSREFANVLITGMLNIGKQLSKSLTVFVKINAF